MITLNTESGLVKIESWEDIELLPGFLINLNPSNHKLDSIIGRYIFKDKICCGLSNCHKPHSKGYIVKTKEGATTNIGKDCGKTYFGVDFETLSNKFDRDATASENREMLWSFKFRIDDLQSQITCIRKGDKGADWINKKITSLKNLKQGCPDEVVRKLQIMVKSRSNVLNVEREATETEVQALEMASNRKITRPNYVEQKIADIRGLDALYPENDLKNILILDLEQNIKAFDSKDIDCLTFEELKYWSKWISTIDNSIDNANQTITAALNLLTNENLSPFLNIVTTNAGKSEFRNFIKQLPL